MRNKLLLLFMFFLTVTMVYGQDDKNINPEELPAQARFFIKTDFSKKEVIYAAYSNRDKAYEVLTSDSTQFRFNKDGQWLSIVSHQSTIPSLVIPHKINTAIRKNCGPNIRITEILKLSRGRYDVELSNGLGLRFDKKLEIVDVRDRELIKQQNRMNREISD